MSIPDLNLKELVDAGVHFGHKTQRWNPKMEKYIHSTRENVHIINLNLTIKMLEEALKIIDQVVSKVVNTLWRLKNKRPPKLLN